MDRFGIDKPDTRFGMEIQDLTGLFKGSAFKVFNVAANTPGSVVRAINAKGLADITQGELTNFENIAKSAGAKGLAFIKCEAGEWKSPIVKFFSDDEKAALKKQLNIEDGDIVFFAAAPWEQASTILGRIRLESSYLLKARGRLNLPADQYNFLWVIEFPLMLWDEEEKRYLSAHHPFTAPVVEDEPLLATDPAKVRGRAILIGATALELGDEFSTTQSATTKGVYIHALAFEALIAGRALVEPSALLMFLAAAVVAFLLRPTRPGVTLARMAARHLAVLPVQQPAASSLACRLATRATEPLADLAAFGRTDPHSRTIRADRPGGPFAFCALGGR